MPIDEHSVIVRARGVPVDADLTPIEAETAADLVRAVRDSRESGEAVLVRPDAVATANGRFDRDLWIALASALVVEGVSAIETAHPRDARRIFDVLAAIQSADPGVVTSA